MIREQPDWVSLILLIILISGTGSHLSWQGRRDTDLTYIGKERSDTQVSPVSIRVHWDKGLAYIN
jgi:hypothetical protein